jgi:hypothetical protein
MATQIGLRGPFPARCCDHLRGSVRLRHPALVGFLVSLCITLVKGKYHVHYHFRRTRRYAGGW